MLRLDLNKFNLVINLNRMFKLLSEIFSNFLGRKRIFGIVLLKKQRQSAIESTFNVFILINAFWPFLSFYQATITNPAPATPFLALPDFQSTTLFLEFFALTKQSLQSLFCSISPFPRENLKFLVLLDIRNRLVDFTEANEDKLTR